MDKLKRYDLKSGGWIRVKDRLPIFDEWVLVYCRIYGQYIGAYQRIDPECDFGVWNDGENSGVLPPTHWQPLPSPPKIESKNKAKMSDKGNCGSSMSDKA